MFFNGFNEGVYVFIVYIGGHAASGRPDNSVIIIDFSKCLIYSCFNLFRCTTRQNIPGRNVTNQDNPGSCQFTDFAKCMLKREIEHIYIHFIKMPGSYKPIRIVMKKPDFSTGTTEYPF